MTLNVWGGKVYSPLMDFITKYANKVDIFCFQEVLFGSDEVFTKKHMGRVNIFSEIQKLLPNFIPINYYAPDNVTYFLDDLLPHGTLSGQVIFVHNSLSIISSDNFRGHKGENHLKIDFGGDITGSFQCVTVMDKTNKITTIVNIHGLWQKETNKLDTNNRLLQSYTFCDFIKSRIKHLILCGDFNLLPCTKSLNMIEQLGMINLIKTFNINSTRSNLYTKKEKFADYIFISPDINVITFEVVQETVSDHLPLYLDFSVSV